MALIKPRLFDNLIGNRRKEAPSRIGREGAGEQSTYQLIHEPDVILKSLRGLLDDAVMALGVFQGQVEHVATRITPEVHLGGAVFADEAAGGLEDAFTSGIEFLQAVFQAGVNGLEGFGALRQRLGQCINLALHKGQGVGNPLCGQIVNTGKLKVGLNLGPEGLMWLTADLGPGVDQRTQGGAVGFCSPPLSSDPTPKTIFKATFKEQTI